jgi:hypothetical protein
MELETFSGVVSIPYRKNREDLVRREGTEERLSFWAEFREKYRAKTSPEGIHRQPAPVWRDRPRRKSLSGINSEEEKTETSGWEGKKG